MKDQLLALADEILQSGHFEWSGRLRALAAKAEARKRSAAAYCEFLDESNGIIDEIRAVETVQNEPCGDNCNCADAGADFPARCYRFAALVEIRLPICNEWRTRDGERLVDNAIATPTSVPPRKG